MNPRIAYLDHLKIYLTFMVVAHHVAQAYGDTGGAWLVFDAAKTEWLGTFMYVNASYLMALYFFISGYFTYRSIQKKTFIDFFKDRLLRLGIPLVLFGICVFVPLHYSLSQEKGSVLHFAYDLYFNKPPLAVGHLWFVMSLMAYSLIISAFSRFLALPPLNFKWYYPLVFIAVLTALNYGLRLHYSIDQWFTCIIPLELVHLPNYFLAFLAGYWVYQQNWMEHFNGKLALIYLALMGIGIALRAYNPILINKIIFENTLFLGLSLSLLVLFRYLNLKSDNFVQSLSGTTYGIYLTHILIVLGYQTLFVPIQISASAKFWVVSILSFFTCYELTLGLKKLPFLGKIIS